MAPKRWNRMTSRSIPAALVHKIRESDFGKNDTISMRSSSSNAIIRTLAISRLVTKRTISFHSFANKTNVHMNSFPPTLIFLTRFGKANPEMVNFYCFVFVLFSFFTRLPTSCRAFCRGFARDFILETFAQTTWPKTVDSGALKSTLCHVWAMSGNSEDFFVFNRVVFHC